MKQCGLPLNEVTMELLLKEDGAEAVDKKKGSKMKTSELTFGYRVCPAVCYILGCEPFIVKQTWLALCSFLGIAQLMVNVMLNLNCFARSLPTLFGGSLRVLSYAYAHLAVSGGALIGSTVYLADYLLVMMTL
jgi:hypothetical protein